MPSSAASTVMVPPEPTKMAERARRLGESTIWSSIVIFLWKVFLSIGAWSPYLVETTICASTRRFSSSLMIGRITGALSVALPMR